MLQVTASDPDHDSLGFAWTSTCPGVFDRADRDQVTFIAGTLATGAGCTFQVSVSDGRGGIATGTLVLSAALPVVNIAPAMGIVYQSTDTADVAEVVPLHASASDPEGQPLTWAWKASDGVLSDQADQAGFSDVRWTAPATPGVRCAITATATDPGGASASFVFTVQVQGTGG
jgi:chitinase